MPDELQALKVGQDPRMLPEYERLRGEINKLSHASRPKVDWGLIHQLSQEICEKQGVDLQTAVYFALARSHLYGLRGFTESCEFLANIIISQWDNVWPPVHQQRARTDILDWYIARVSGVIRQYTISREDNRLIYRCERALQLMSEKLYNVGLSRVPRVENLVHFIEGYTSLFDESEASTVTDSQDLPEHDRQLPPLACFFPDVASSTQNQSAAVNVATGQEQRRLTPAVLKMAQRKKSKPAWLWFTVGLLTCAVPVAVFASWLYWNSLNNLRITRAVATLEQPARALPEPLSMNQLRDIRIVLGEQMLQDLEPRVTSDYQMQLNRVQHISPLWLYQHADALRYSARILYPDSQAIRAMDTQWQQMIRASQEDRGGDASWISVNRGVDNLLAQLLDLERKNKTVTISHLKSVMYDLQKNLNEQIPLSVRLQRMEKKQVANEPLSLTELNLMTAELQSLTVRLYALQQTRENP